jgi:hypothetical protein
MRETSLGSNLMRSSRFPRPTCEESAFDQYMCNASEASCSRHSAVVFTPALLISRSSVPKAARAFSSAAVKHLHGSDSPSESSQTGAAISSFLSQAQNCTPEHMPPTRFARFYAWLRTSAYGAFAFCREFPDGEACAATAPGTMRPYSSISFGRSGKIFQRGIV